MADLSGGDAGKTSLVLLPAAKVALHVKDSETREAASRLAKDWRFARITFDIHEGSIETATQFYKDKPSPDLVIVETSTIENEFTDRLTALAENCSENTSAVIIGPVNDVYLYRKMIDMGVSDYLVKPVTIDVLTDVISKTLIEKFGAPDSKLIAVVGAKGGVGASSFANAVSWSIADRLDEKTIMLDAAGGWSYLSVSMGAEPLTNFSEITRLASGTDEAAFNRMVLKPSEKLSVLATGAEPMLDDQSNPAGFELLINKLMVTYPVVVADLSGASAAVKRVAIARAHEIIVVSSPSLPSLRGARSLIQEIKTLRGDSDRNVHFVINKSGEATGLEVSAKDIETALDRKPALTIPYDPKAFMASESQGKKLHEIKAGEAITASILNLLRGIMNAKTQSGTGLKTEDKSLMGGLLSKFKGQK